MACRQIVPGRRWCRFRPFLMVLVLAAYLFYQTLMPLRSKRPTIPTSGNGLLPSKAAEVQRQTHQILARRVSCFLPSNKQQGQKEIEDTSFKLFSHKAGEAILHIPSSGSGQDLPLYQQILIQHSYRVTIAEERKLSRHENLNPDELRSWDLLICLSSNKADHENCINIVKSYQPTLLQKANVLSQIQHLLCRKEGLCQIMRTFPDLHLPIISSACPESKSTPLHTLKSYDKNERMSLIETLHQPVKAVHQHPIPIKTENKEAFKIQDFSIIIKVYVLVSSLTPLQAFIHSTGIVWDLPKKKHFSVKLQTFFQTFLRAASPQQALDDMKEAISKLLLITEVFSEAALPQPQTTSQCSSCFQMLTFDIGFGHTFYPIVLEVHEYFDFQADEDSFSEDQTVKEILLRDTFSILLSNQTSASTFFEAMQNVYRSARIKDDHFKENSDYCLTLEELNPLISFVKGIQNPGQFELLLPSAVPKIHFLLHDLYRMMNSGKKLNSILALHWFLSSLLKQFQRISKVASANLPKEQNHSTNKPSMTAKWSNLGISYSEKNNIQVRVSSPVKEKDKELHILNLAKEMHCSHDKDTLPHIRQIITSPHLDLNPNFDPRIKEYYTEVPFDLLTIKIRAEPMNCQCEAHLDERQGPSSAHYPLGLGINIVIIVVTDKSRSVNEIVSIYKIIIFREDRPSLPLFDDFMLCGFVQDCGSVIHPEESCGLQPLSAEYLSTVSQPQLKTCEMGDVKGQWVVPCLSCSDNRTCDWRQITWQPRNCQYPVLNKPELQKCVKRKKVLFIGDSTNRGMMYYLIERVNETLQEWQKAHGMKFYHNVNNGSTFISYSYYPQFWISISQRPTFEEALEQLLLRSQPLENTDQTILVIGGVQWLNFSHLHIIQKVLKRMNLSNIMVVIKSLGMGFHLPVDRVHTLSSAEIQNLWKENLAILNTAKLYGYEVVDTFIITMGRYKEFLQGKCGCHFHEVVKSKASEKSFPTATAFSRLHVLGKYFNNQSNLAKLQASVSNSQSPYHVRGPINQVCSEILLSRICGNNRKDASM
ncbi:cadherin-like and PC-esterase domain-containing protein 1 [Protobothrops mucrosquamatus]|uniref:cadherin-like and PC-esterase domain-containing protein 1 n=1 Tax=Protobothrops mucrosquamatus TaxID=103944 RepID=UPI0010FB88A6|nr:cadherin-like and PC-esterase domain-containing protein 1 [Protobothrops mucrosquamatus]